MYICPVCGKKLISDKKRFFCSGGHSYDISSSGYVNLLTGGGKSHGDGADMIAARRRFLQGGYYDPLCKAVIEEVKKARPCRLLDAGCGEGYYTKRIKEALPECLVCGFDISKKAAEKAAKLGGLEICVASAYRMPYGDGYFDCAVNIFSPLALDEYRRVLRKGGELTVALPAPDHLIELKAAVYDNVTVKETKSEELSGFELKSRTDIRYSAELDNAALNDLFMMTPYYHKTSQEDKDKLKDINSMTVTASFTVLTYSET